jgi:hypothetical protein
VYGRCKGQVSRPLTQSLHRDFGDVETQLFIKGGDPRSPGAKHSCHFPVFAYRRSHKGGAYGAVPPRRPWKYSRTQLTLESSPRAAASTSETCFQQRLFGTFVGAATGSSWPIHASSLTLIRMNCQARVCSTPSWIASLRLSRLISLSALNLMQYPVTLALPMESPYFRCKYFLSSMPMM